MTFREYKHLKIANNQYRENAYGNLIINRQKRCDSIHIVIGTHGNDFSRETIKKWFSEFTLFNPDRMSSMADISKYRSRKYKQETLFEWISDEIRDMWNVTYYGDHITYAVYASIDKDTSLFYATIPKSVWDEDKEDFLKKYESVFIELGGCFGFFVNDFDYYIVQNPSEASTYLEFKVDENDYTGIMDIPLIDPIVWIDDYSVAKANLSGHVETYSKMQFTSAPYMWVGPDFYTFFPKESIEAYTDCVENIEISPGYRRICLWENIAEYNHPIYRRRQWSFRRSISMDAILKELRSKPLIYKNGDSCNDPHIEFKRGKFKHGGELLVMFYVDEANCNTKKSKAIACIEREMNGNTIVWEKRKKL